MRQGGGGLGCEPFGHLASPFVDGELPPGELERFDTHLAGCADCRREHEDVRAIVALAGELPESVEPARDLWDAIEPRLAARSAPRPWVVWSGLAAAAAQIMTDPDSTVPMVGASGAIGGVMGAYAILFPRARVHLLIILVFYVTTISVPAVLMLGYWFLLQLLSGVGTLGAQGGGVAFWAHIGGFLAGVVLVRPFVNRHYLAQHRRHTRRLGSRHRLF